MKRIINSILFFLVVQLTFTQTTDSIGLLTCLQMARQNAPSLKGFELQKKIFELKNNNLSATNLPELSAYGKAWYQNDAITVTIPVSGMSGIEVDKFQYNFGLNVDQKLYDGSISVRKKDLEQVDFEVENSRLETDLYKLNHEVSNLYFTVLLLKDTRKVIELKHDNLKVRRQNLLSAFKNGMIAEIQVRKIETEVLSTQQLLDEINLKIQQTLQTLKVLIGFDNTSDLNLVREIPIEQLPSGQRPEYDLFEKQEQKLITAGKLQTSKILPHLYAYGQLGYSYPGLNFFENQDDYYYIIGVRLGWTIFDWNQTGREKQILETRRKEVEIQKQEFNRQLKIAKTKEQIELDRLKEFIEADKKIISEKELITKASASSLENGTMTTAEYLVDLNSEIRSRIEYESHQIELLKAQANMAILSGINVKND